MADETTEILESVIEYIETHLNQKLNQDTVAFAVGYSKYHLNRLFSNHLSMTIHQYIMRRRFTEAARLLVLSDKPIMQIAAQYGYGSSQAFSSAFKSVYKVSPAEYRKRSLFFPLQLRFSINRLIPSCRFTADDIEPIAWHGREEWIKFAEMVMDAYPPIVDKQSVLQSKSKVSERSGLVLKDNGMIIAVMEYNITSAYIKFWGVHPQYRNIGIEEVFLQALSDRYLPDAETITISTYRENDKADTGHRDMLIRLGFEPDKLMEEYGYPKQILVYKPK